ncbi:MAG: 3'-5' exonuclease [Bacteriovoracaceae bacterium]|nr:3'-5' exonuclease [Bacteriovoracaceae bacterium]
MNHHYHSSPYIASLNPAQREAATHIEGPLLILAGAGSGKTKTITYRMAHMMEDYGIGGDQILALSFTNKAAREMLTRLRTLVPAKRRKGITLSTFHSLGLKILRESIQHLNEGYDDSFTIYDSADQMSLLRQILKNVRAEKNFDRSTLLSLISKMKNASIRPSEFYKHPQFNPDNKYHEFLLHVYPAYQEQLKLLNALDFDDILFHVCTLFKERPDIADHYSQKFKFIMVDEYQDTNPIQFQILQGLTRTHQNICVVGDDDQAIYSFRGADISNILSFEFQFPSTKVVKLEENYRSTQRILHLANSIIKHNKKRKDKTLWSQKDSGPVPLLWQCQDESHEAQLIAEHIQTLMNQSIHLSEVAILVRGQTQMGALETELKIAQIPYRLIGGQEFYEKKEIKDILAYLSLISNPKDDLSFRRIINTPTRGIGPKTIETLVDIAGREKKPLTTIAMEAQNYPELTKLDSLDSVKNFAALIRDCKTLFQNTSLDAGLEKLYEELKYRDYVRGQYEKVTQVDQKLKDLDQLIQLTKRYCESHSDVKQLSPFLSELVLSDAHSKHNATRDEEGKVYEVTLMTMHASKGLEFDVVFLPGMEEEILPHKKSIDGMEDLSEERRLAYVAITRAREKLIMSYSKEKKMYNKMVPRKLSRFLIGAEEFYQAVDRTSFESMEEGEFQKYKDKMFDDIFKSLD